jgi:hypothetical protein
LTETSGRSISGNNNAHCRGSRLRAQFAIDGRDHETKGLKMKAKVLCIIALAILVVSRGAAVASDYSLIRSESNERTSESSLFHNWKHIQLPAIHHK